MCSSVALSFLRPLEHGHVWLASLSCESILENQFSVAAALATVEQMTSEITIPRTKVNEVIARVQSLEEQRGHLFAQIRTISGQIFATSSKTKGPKNVLTSKSVSDVPSLRQTRRNVRRFKVKNNLGSEGEDFSPFFRYMEDHDGELNHLEMRSYRQPFSHGLRSRK